MKIDSRELRNSYNSSRGINAGATIGYGHKIQTTGNGGSISASQSNQNTVETVYANGNFRNVNEVHNNTGSMVLNGFNQEGGKVTGNIGKVEVISRQNTSTTTGSSSGISLGISANGVPSSVNISGSRTNGDRAFVDNQSTFIVGEGSSLHVGTLENTGAVIGKEGNSTFKIDSYIGKDIQNHDTMKTTGGSLGISTEKPRITNVGFNQDSRDKQGITRNTVVGDVEIAGAEGSPINRDLGKANEVTRDTHSSTNINVESQTIEYATNPAKLKEDIGKAKDEIEAVGAVAKAAFNTIGSKEKNGFFDFLRTERVQETVRNLGYIDTKGKTKEQIAQEMQDKYGEIFAKNGKKLEINFYVNSEVSQDDPDAKNKMNAAGFTAEDGSIWLNADNISSMNNFDLNSVFAHEGTHKVTGKDTELLADFGQSRAEKFINKSIDKGYLTRTGGGLNWEDGNLTEEQKQRLAEYTDEDIQFRMLTGDDRIDRRVNVNPNARRVNYQKQLNEVGRLERMYKKIDAKKAEEKRKHVNSVTNSLERKYSGKFIKKNGTYAFYNANDRKKFEKEANQKGVQLKTRSANAEEKEQKFLEHMNEITQGYYKYEPEHLKIGAKAGTQAFLWANQNVKIGDGSNKVSNETVEKAASSTIGQAVASGHYKLIPTEDKKYENDNPHVQEQVKAAKAEAKRRTAESKDKDYYVRVDGKNKTVTVEESDRPKGYGSYLFRDVILNPLQSGNNFFNAEKSLLSGDLGGAFKNTVTGVGNLFSPFTFGIGSWAGDNYARFKPEEVQYGTKQEVENRKNTENAIVKTGIDTIVTFNLPKKIGNGKITLPQVEPAVTLNSSGVLTQGVSITTKTVSTPAITLTGGGKAGAVISNAAKAASNINDGKDRNNSKTSNSNNENTGRPTYKQSENDLTKSLEETYKNNPDIEILSQKSYLGKESAEYGTKGSVRPDNIKLKNNIPVESFEMKNYKLQNYDNMANTIVKQVEQRRKNLPLTVTKQNIVIDARGQGITAVQEKEIIQKIIEKSNGTIKKSDITIWK